MEWAESVAPRIVFGRRGGSNESLAFPLRLKPVDVAGLTAGLKSRPFKTKTHAEVLTRRAHEDCCQDLVGNRTVDRLVHIPAQNECNEPEICNDCQNVEYDGPHRIRFLVLLR